MAPWFRPPELLPPCGVACCRRQGTETGPALRWLRGVVPPACPSGGVRRSLFLSVGSLNPALCLKDTGVSLKVKEVVVVRPNVAEAVVGGKAGLQRLRVIPLTRPLTRSRSTTMLSRTTSSRLRLIQRETSARSAWMPLSPNVAHHHHCDCAFRYYHRCKRADHRQAQCVFPAYP